MLITAPLRFVERTNNKWLEADAKVSSATWNRTRILCFGLLLIGPHIPRLGAVANLPEQLLDPTWRFPAGFVAGAPSALLIGISLLTVLCAALALGGVRTRTFGLATAGLLLVGNSVLYSVAGKIVHHQWTAIAIAIFSVSLWAGKDKAPGAWSPRFLVAWVIGWGLVTSAVEKVRGGWLNPSYSVVRVELDLQAAAQGVFAPGNQINVDFPGAGFIWELADWSTVLMEAGLVVAVLISPAFFRWGIVLLVGFHISVFVFLGISFVAVLPAYLPFAAEFLPKRHNEPQYVVAVAAVLGLFTAGMILGSEPDGTVWLLSALRFPLENPAGLPLLIVPVLAVYSVVRGGSILRST